MGSGDTPDQFGDYGCPDLEVIEKTRTAVRKYLASEGLIYTESKYEHYSIFKLDSCEINLLNFECCPTEDGQVFVNQVFYDPFFGAGGARRLGSANVLKEGFEGELTALLGKATL